MALLFKTDKTVEKVTVDSMKEVQVRVGGEVRIMLANNIHYILSAYEGEKNEIASEIASVNIFGNAILMLFDEYEEIKS